MTPAETAALLRQRAQAMLDWPLVETAIEEGKTILKPARWSLADAPKLLQLADELDPPQTPDQPLDFAGSFPAPPDTPGQPESRAALRRLLDAPERPAWWQDYLAIREAFPHFKNWRIWVYIAWAGQPAAARQPRTVQELAEQVLGCTDRAVRNWHAASYGDKADIAEAIAWVQASPLLKSRRDYYETLDFMAKQRDARNFNYLKLALEMMGDYPTRPRPEPDVTIDLTFKKRLDQIYQDDNDIIDLPAIEAG